MRTVTIRAAGRAACALAVLATLALPPAESRGGALGRNRLHLTRGKLLRRLGPDARAAVRATVSVGSSSGDEWGTGCVVQRGRDSALVLTCFHVARDLGDPVISFEDLRGRRRDAPVLEVLATSAELDYALVRTAVPRGVRIKPLQLSRAPFNAGEKLLNVGYHHLGFLSCGGADSYDFAAREAELLTLERVTSRQRTIQVGAELGGGEVRRLHDPDPRPEAREPIPRFSAALNLTSAPGGSGSPLLSATDPRVVKGLLWSGGGAFPRSQLRLDDPGFVWTQAAYAVPASLILDDLKRRLTAGELTGRDAAAVRRLVSRAR